MPNGQQVINMIEYLANNYADGDAEMVDLILEGMESVTLYVYDNQKIQFTPEDESYMLRQDAFMVHSADLEYEIDNDNYSHITVLYN